MSLSKEINYVDLEACKAMVKELNGQVGAFNQFKCDLEKVAARFNPELMGYTMDGLTPRSHWSNSECCFQKFVAITPGKDGDEGQGKARG